MDGLDILIVVLFVIFSVWSELRKGGSKKDDSSIDADLGDLDAISEFFKKQEKKARKQDRLVEIPMERMESESPYTSTGVSSYEGASNSKQRFKQRKTGRKERKSESHYGFPSDEGECLDEAPSLSGKVNYERGMASLTDADRKNKADAPQRQSRQVHKRWSRRQIVNGFLFSELFNRYDINRIYSRIPDRREL